MKKFRIHLILVLGIFGILGTNFARASDQQSRVMAHEMEDLSGSTERLWFEYKVGHDGIQKIQIKGDCITIYFTENSHRFCKISRCCFNCAGCFSFIHRDDLEHDELHKTSDEMEFSHFHL